MRSLRQIKLTKVDWFEHQRRESAIAHDIGKRAAREGEQNARRFGEQKGLKLVFGNVAKGKQARIRKFDLKCGLVRRRRFHVDFQDDFVHVVANLARRDVELDINLRLPLPLINSGRVWIFERQILHILRNNAGLRAGIFAVGKCFGALFVGHVV